MTTLDQRKELLSHVQEARQVGLSRAACAREFGQPEFSF